MRARRAMYLPSAASLERGLTPTAMNVFIAEQCTFTEPHGGLRSQRLELLATSGGVVVGTRLTISEVAATGTTAV